MGNRPGGGSFKFIQDSAGFFWASTVFMSLIGLFDAACPDLMVQIAYQTERFAD
jgi:hypothetical protein